MTDSSGPGLLELLTGALALGTGWLAFETRLMSRATLQMAKLQVEPDLNFVTCGLEIVQGPDPVTRQIKKGVRPKIVFGNPSNVRVTYSLRQCLVTLAGTPKPMPKIDSVVGIIHPKQPSDYFYTFIEWPLPLQSPFTWTLELVVDFWAVPNIRHSLSATIETTVENAATGGGTFRFLKGPTYSPS